MTATLLYKRLPHGRVRCDVCQRRCIIAQGKRGHCRTRLNDGGKLYSLIYGKVSSLSINPIEKKPVFHFYPGSRWLSLGSLGCNFRCPGCQNWEISHARIDSNARNTEYISPAEAVQLAKDRGCQGISWTFNEPTLWFEYTVESAKLAKKENLHTNYVTNGFITPEALDVIGPYLDVFRVDIKGFSRGSYSKIANISKFNGILEVTKRAKEKWNMHVEIVTNVIPGYNDHEKELRDIASWIRRELGEDTPWHVTRFHPHLDLAHVPPTPVSTLERGRQIGFEEGLHYVYLGNVPGHPGENTYCFKCRKLLIERFVFDIKTYNLVGNRCPDCGHRLTGRFYSNSGSKTTEL